MAHEIDLKNYKIRTDIIVDTFDKNIENKGICHTTINIGDIIVDDIVIDKAGEKTCNKSPGNYKIITFFILLMLLILIYSFNFNGISTICVGICGVLNLYGTIMCNEQGLRIFGIIGSSFYAAFMFFTGNIVGTLCEIICFAPFVFSSDG